MAADAVEDRIISDEYKLWKKNVPFMYDYLINRIFEYPTPVVQWFDSIEQIDDDDQDGSIVQKLLVATNPGPFEDDYYLAVHSVILPDLMKKFEPKKIDLYSMREDAFGAFVFYTGNQTEADFKVVHNGMVTCARCMPEKNAIVATKNSNDLFIWDLKDCIKNSKQADSTEPISQFLNLNNQSDLDWNPQSPRLLLSGFESNQLAIWDISSQKKRKTMIPKTTMSFNSEFDTNQSETNEILSTEWHRHHTDIVGASTSNGSLLLWDIRSPALNQPSHRFRGHKGSAKQIKFSPFSEFVFISSGIDGQICVWDLRNLKIKLHSILFKKESFQSIKWSPHCETLFGAITQSDRKVYLFDLDRILDEQMVHEVEDGPPTLIFIHGGHTSKVLDFDWNPNKNNPLVVCSVSDDNVYQIWQMTSSFVVRDNQKADI
ncbi:hypothetical protein SSS_09950 [Sarcoptes scabiei]|nr:hypothetical protein SSS_09950 [Sarcoptes scabiei]